MVATMIQPEAKTLVQTEIPKAESREVMIRTSELWKTYVMGDEEIHALRGVSFEIKRGEYVAIIGPSGSGKSTLMMTICGDWWIEVALECVWWGGGVSRVGCALANGRPASPSTGMG